MTTDTIQLAHGGGGRLTRKLIADEILTRFGDGPLRDLPDSAVLPSPEADIVFTTDSFVVKPFKFPGGNIGDLAVYGTVNDMAACGGKPLWLSVALILEEGFPMADLRCVLDSIQAAADRCDVQVVTGDTKVVGRGQCDGIYVNTAGIGRKLPGFNLSAQSISPGDDIIITGPIGDHGMAVLCARENILIRNGTPSDCGPVHRLVETLTPAEAAAVRFLRDPTRGGLAAVLNEISAARSFGVVVDESTIPVAAGTRASAEMLGLDPLHLACEGRLLAVCAPDATEPVLRAWRRCPEGAGAVRIGSVSADHRGRVIMNTVAGGRRLVDHPGGELLPRIC